MRDVIRLLVAGALAAAAGAARADGDAARGEKKFEECAACHKIAPGEDNVGPSLHGVFGRKAGTLADFRYSPALKRSAITWTPQTMDEFVADPQKIEDSEVSNGGCGEFVRACLHLYLGGLLDCPVGACRRHWRSVR